MYHLQLSEGNLINNLKLGLEKGWIHLADRDVPDARNPARRSQLRQYIQEPGTAKYSGLWIWSMANIDSRTRHRSVKRAARAG
jgi:hypothetical protein